MRQSGRVLLGMELKVVAPSLMWKEAVLVVQYSIFLGIVCFEGTLEDDIH